MSVLTLAAFALIIVGLVKAVGFLWAGLILLGFVILIEIL